MRWRFDRRLFLVALITLLIGPAPRTAKADGPAVRAVLFYSPSCGHCHKVITEDLPPLFQKYGDRLQMIGVDVSEASGGALYNAAADKFNVPPEERGVPMLVVADVMLMGSQEIPERFPGLMEQYLDAGGVDWPDIPGMADVVAQAEAQAQAAAAQATSAPAPTAQAQAVQSGVTPAATDPAAAAQPPQALAFAAEVSASGTTAGQQAGTTDSAGLLLAGDATGSLRERFGRDPVGNGLAVVVLAGMVAAVAWVLASRPWRWWRGRGAGGRSWRDWVVLGLSIVGLGVAGYLAYVETQQVRAVCGPVGDCNRVQQSDYARLFGLVPIGVIGVLGYLAILAAWVVVRVASGEPARWARAAIPAMAAVGVLFSIYLTFLEPFVIGATCAWCLSSAVIMTLVLLLTVRPAWHASGAVEGVSERQAA